MKPQADLYDSHYGRLDDEVYRSIRAETFGVDLGQESWITADECDQLCGWLGIRAGSRVLEVACGAGGISSRLAERLGASVVGTDVNPIAIAAAKSQAAARSTTKPVEFLTSDADSPLPFPDESFDVVFCNDAINHFRDRSGTLEEWKRVLRIGGQCLFTDPVVITGLVTNAELAARSSIGFFTFSVPGANETHLENAGFRVERVADMTESVARVSRAWHAAREKRRSTLIPIETESKYEALQRFLAATHVLAHERRLSRFVYIGRRIEGAGKKLGLK